MSDTEHQNEALAQAVEAYLVARYRGADLKKLARRDIQFEDSNLARTLYNWREASLWDKPHIIGERRCVDCTDVMYEQPSACEDETVCAKCARSATHPPLGRTTG